MHRDFKPDNILLDERLTAYLADTGFAKDQRPDASGRSKSNVMYMTMGYAHDQQPATLPSVRPPA